VLPVVKKLTSDNPKPSTLLRHALYLFGPKGERWIQDEYHISPGNYEEYPEGAFCAVGMMNEINTNNEDIAIGYLAKAIDKSFKFDNEDGDNGDDTVIGFNDTKYRSFSDIKKIFNKAIKMAMKDGR